MKKIALILFTVLGIAYYTHSQVPEYFNYQAVLRNSEGELVVNTNVNFQLSILEGSAEGLPVFTESQLVKSNSFGVCNIRIGQGSDASGSLLDLDWGSTEYFLKVEVDIAGNTSFNEIGTMQLVSVPYSYYSHKATSSTNSVNAEIATYADHSDTSEVAKKLDEDVLYFTNTDTLFAVKDRSGNIVFAVFPDGAKVYVNEGVKGRVGGFAVTGRNPTKADYLEEEYLLVTPDSTRVWVNEDVTKARVGGFAVTGRNPTKGMSGDYLVVTKDSTRIWVNEDETKARVGGFAVTGRNPTKGMSGDYLLVTSDSTRIYLNDTTNTKARVGGFAVTGRNPTKGPNDDYLRVTRDSTRIYITESSTKARVGGFAVTGRNPTKGDVTKDYLNVSGNLSADVVNNESRVMWYPKKSALLAGEVHVGSADSVGTNSTALGYRSIAMGEQSQSFGFQTQALANYSTAIGKNALAESESAFAFGEDAKALNNESYAIGRGAIASGYRSFAFGSAGIDTLGVETDNTMALGDYSIALGQGSYTNANGAIALGTGAKATQGYSFAAGYYTNAQGYFSNAFGSLTYATGNHSTAFGENTHATGAYSVAFGFHSDATNTYAFSFGNESEATHIYSWASGNKSHAYADYATAIGQELTANKINEFVIGRYNSTVSSARNSWLSTDPLFIIGNGSATTPSNAFVVYKNGNADVNGRLKVGGGNIGYATGLGDLYVADVLEVDNDVVVSDELSVGDYLLAYGGIHIGSTTPLDPGTSNLIVDGTSTFKGASYFSSTANFNNITTFYYPTTFYDNMNMYTFAKVSNSSTPPISYVGSNGDLYVQYDIEADGNVYTTGYVAALGGIHVGGTTTPGTDNIAVDGDFSFSTGKDHYIGLPDNTKTLNIGPSMAGSTSYPWGIYGRAAGFVSFRILGQTDHSIHLSSAGVGINRTNPTVALDVYGSIEYTGTISDVSDIRLKENIKLIENSVDRLKQIKGISYNLIGSDDVELGVIAQDVQKVFPEAVTLVDPDDGILGVSYVQLVPVLIEAVKDQQEIIENQNEVITNLEERISKLEQLIKNK